MKYVINVVIRYVLLLIIIYFIPEVSFNSWSNILYFCLATSLISTIVRAIVLNTVSNSIFTNSLTLGILMYCVSFLLNLSVIYLLFNYYPIVSISSTLWIIITASVVSIDFSGMES